MIVEKMTAAFQKAEGGLFGNVAKADVGDAAASMKEKGIRLMCWADPFYPAPSIPQHVLKATVDSLNSDAPCRQQCILPGDSVCLLLSAGRLCRFQENM